MTNPDDPARPNRPAAQGAAPSWVDEVLGTSRAAPTAPAPAQSTSAQPAPAQPVPAPAQELRLPESPAQPAPAWADEIRRPAPAQPGSGQASQHQVPTAYADDDWVARATGAQAKSPGIPTGPTVPPSPVRSELDSLGDSARHAMQQVGSAFSSSDVSQKKLIAGLLGIVLGSLGVHKFYLGLTTPGLIMLGVNVGVWVLALLLGLVTLGVGLIVTVPLASLVSGAIGLLGLVEGILYLTKSDADFQREYVLGKKPWL